MRSTPTGQQRWLTAAVLATLATSLGCLRKDAEPGSPAVFGGKGATPLGLQEKPLPEGAGAPEAAGPCGRSSAPNEQALLDDFEDGDNKLFKGFEREGYWYASSDNTEGSLITPVGDFAAEALPQAESSKDNRYAAHLAASGQKQWGVIWGSGLKWVRRGIKCPLNVSGFAGVRFRAKGPGTIRLSLAVPEVMPKDEGGSCKDGCYDTHGKRFVLNDTWETYDVLWDRLQQGGWGTEARFTPERLINLGINVDIKSLPIDFWVDDFELIPKAGAATKSAP